MDIKWLEDLLVLLEEKSFTRAAVRRHVTQPAFSRRIRLLEDWLGVDIIDRSTKPVQVLPIGISLEEGVRDLVNRLYFLRSNLQASAINQDRVSFVVVHTLAISLFPALIQQVKQVLPTTSYCVNPQNNDDCESVFFKGADLMLAYELALHRFDFSNLAFDRFQLGVEKLVPVVSAGFFARFDSTQAMLSSRLPALMYQKDGIFSEALTNTCLPAVLRDYQLDIICESPFSASLKEMALADMGLTWLAGGIVNKELDSGQLISLEEELGSAQLDIVLFCREDNRSSQARQVFDLIRKTADPGKLMSAI
ncbi:MAG: LysR family transcriptional regulator [Gammaproteobacteria bacterium]|nr:LysR family transcriptional regulator [Gammaproteobacteria bacterium]